MSHQDQRAHKEMLLKQATKTKELVCGVVSEFGVMFCNMSEPVPEKPHVLFFTPGGVRVTLPLDGS